MAQILLPDADIAVGSWTTTPLFSKVDDDSTVNPTGDGTEISSDAVGNNSDTTNADLGLTSGTDPASSTGHIIRARWHRSAAGAMTATCELWQGTPGTGTLIATLTQASVTEAEQESTYTLSGTEADSITDYSTVNLRLRGRGTSGGPARSLVVDLVELEVPDAAGGVTVAAAQNLPAVVQSFEAEAEVSATVAQSLPGVDQSANLNVDVDASAVQTLSEVTQIAALDVSVGLTAAQSLPEVAQSAVFDLDANLIAGQSLPEVTQSATVDVSSDTVTVTAGQNLAGITQSAVLDLDVDYAASQTLPQVSQTTTVDLAVDVTAGQTLAEVTQAAVIEEPSEFGVWGLKGNPDPFTWILAQR